MREFTVNKSKYDQFDFKFDFVQGDFHFNEKVWLSVEKKVLDYLTDHFDPDFNDDIPVKE